VIPKVALITGAGRGAGRQLAEWLAGHGYSLALNDISPLNLEETQAAAAARGVRVIPYEFDTTRLLPVQALVQQVLDDFGQVDALINAAWAAPTDSILDMDEWDFHRTLDVNLTGAFLLMQRVGRWMQTHGGGIILNVLPPPKGGAVSRSSLAALEALSRAAAEEFYPHAIQVHALPIELIFKLLL
jgi:NAD(P)-dependent dehydrogenase (short-subunit alcohol dehydrogenase family)